MKFRPLHDQIVVRRREAGTVTAGGILIPDTVDDNKPQEGHVLAAGKGKREKDGSITETVVKAGDRIVFTKHAGHKVKIDGEEVLIMEEKDIIGILPPL